jgi:hypothetical protein
MSEQGVTPRQYVENLLEGIANGTIPPERHDPQRQASKQVLVPAGEYGRLKAENADLLNLLEAAEQELETATKRHDIWLEDVGKVMTAARVASGYITNALVRAILLDALAAYDANESANG